MTDQTLEIRTQEDVSRVLQQLRGERSYHQLARDWPGNSVGAAYSWVTGLRRPTVQSLVRVLETEGYRLVVAPK